MLTINAILERLKGELGTSKDSDIARALNVSRNAPATWKKRGTIPLEELAEFAEREQYNLGWILNGQGVSRLNIVQEPTNSYRLRSPAIDIRLLIEAVKLARSTGREFTDEQFAELVVMIYVYVSGEDDEQELTVDDSKIIQFADIASRR